MSPDLFVLLFSLVGSTAGPVTGTGAGRSKRETRRESERGIWSETFTKVFFVTILFGSKDRIIFGRRDWSCNNKPVLKMLLTKKKENGKVKINQSMEFFGGNYL